MKKFVLRGVRQTQKMAEIMAGKILKAKPHKYATVLALEGDLGSGKTTFLQGFAKGLRIKEKILSPTFVIVKRYSLQQYNNITIEQFNNFYHIDCYRIKNARELLDLGFKDIISNPQNIVAVEWAERVAKIIPKDALKLRFKFINQSQREIISQLGLNKL